jgi:hypothetical protein
MVFLSLVVWVLRNLSTGRRNDLGMCMWVLGLNPCNAGAVMISSFS